MWTGAARERHKDDGRRTPSDPTDAKRQTIEPVPRGCAVLKVDPREIRLLRAHHRTRCTAT